MVDQLVLRDLLNGGWKALEFKPFKPGITAHWLLEGAPAIALLKYEPGARAPLHLHEGLETILILDGAQCDAQGSYKAGDFVTNTPGTSHEVWSDEGCVALLQWVKPVRFL